MARHFRGKPIITVVHCAGFDGESPCIEVRVGKRLAKSISATRNWQNERRTAIRLGMQLAELIGLIAERLFQENGTWMVQEAYETATTVARTQAVRRCINVEVWRHLWRHH